MTQRNQTTPLAPDEIRKKVLELSSAKRALLDLRMKKKEAEAGVEGCISRRDGRERARLSFAQQRLWFLQQLEADSPAYNVYGSVKLKGRLNEEALRRSLREIMRRHEALRTRFEEVEGQAMQVVGEGGEVELPVIELHGVKEREREILRQAMEEARTPFDLKRGPLLRGKLLRLGEEEHVLLLTMHHIVSDGWSVGVLVRELGVLYESYMRGQESPLEELGIQYADYAEWQREYLQGEVLEEQLRYWRKQLGGELPVVELPTDHARPAVRSYRGARQGLRVSREVTEKLKQVSREEGATLFMTLLAAFNVLLMRYSGQEELVVGTPIANRTRVETEELIGCFVNTLVMRVDASGNPPFRELVQRVKQVALEGYAHQDVPFEKLVEELQPKRDLSRTALFQLMFVLQNAPMAETKLGGLTLEEVEFDRKVAKFDLTVTMEEAEGWLAGAMEYNTDLFEAGTMARLVAHWERLLEGIAENAEERVWALPLMGEAERRQVLEEWNETEDWYPREKTIVKLFEEQVERTPEQVAVVYEGESLSYAELNRRANQLARRLRAWGVGQETLVGLCLKRSMEMVVGLLGVLKAGGAYVPLEPDYPRERLEFLLADTAVKVVLTTQASRKTILGEGLHILSLDSEWNTVAGEQDANLDSGALPENLAYVIYTSGSTGKPKGVMNTHAGLCNRLWWMQQHYRLDKSDRVLQKTPFSFDVSVWEFLWPLMTGARLVVARPEGHRDSGYLVQLIEQAQITTLHFVPSMLQIFVEEPELPRCKTLRRVICSGEALSAELQDRFFARLETVELHNLYGPTEAAIDVTYWGCQRNSESHTVPIGRPISNIQMYLLDRYRNPVPVGVLGELHIGGVGLARGYRNRAELTAEKFVANPFGKESGARLYKTGDLARYRPDGVLEYVGRIDHQVKIRGFRIELGEIEAALLQHEGVRESVVLAREDTPGQKRLVAYVVPEKQPVPTLADLRNWVKERLPEYMVPAAFVMLPAMPVTHNGKIDHRALPAPEASRPELAQAYLPPRTPVEETLANIWAEVLKLERVGIHDNFFELGGDSILAIQVISRANEAGLFLTSKQLFQSQTVRELATVVDHVQPVEAQQGLITGSVPLTPVQLWFFEQELASFDHWNQTALLIAREPIQVEKLRGAVESLLLHHDALRLRFTRDDSGWHQINAGLEGDTPFSTRDLSKLAPNELPAEIERIAAETQSSLNLAKGPLIRVVLLQLGSTEPDRLLIVVHHLVVDGVSWRILLEDLQTAYRQGSGGEPIPLPSKTTSFRKWASELDTYAQSNADLCAEQEFWANQRCSDTRQLPVDLPNGRNNEGSVESVTTALSRSETQALLRDVPEIYHTQINDFLLAALVRTLGPWSGTDTIALDLEGHGREEFLPGLELGRTVGWFTSIFPVCLRCAPESNQGMALKSVKEQLRAVPRRGVGYGLLRYLGPAEIREKLGKDVPPQIQFNYLGQFDNVFSESSLFGPATESAGACQDPRNLRRYLLQINSSVTAGQLRMTWLFSHHVHRRSTIERLADDYLQELRSLLEHCQTSSAGGYTPSDFPLAKLGQSELDRLLGNGRRIEDVYPLSPAQQGLLFHTLTAPDAGMYFMQLSFKVEGEFDSERFQEAWREVVARHTNLRTALSWRLTQDPLQLVYRRVDVPFEFLDWRRHSSTEQQQLLNTYLREQKQHGFDLTTAPLFRLTLIDLGRQAHQFVWAWSHLILDGWCVPLVLKEVFETYQSKCGRSNLIVRNSPSYREYIAWLQKQDLSKAEAFWRQALKGFTAPTPIAVAQRATAALHGEYAEQSMRLPVWLSEELQAFARRQQVTLNVVAEGAWAILLSRYTGEDDVVFGATVSGRPAELPQVDSMLGLFINTLPVRVRIASEDLPGPWLRKLQAEQAELREHEYSPLVHVHEWSELPAGTALFDNILVFENYPIDASGDWQQNLKLSNVHTFERTNYPLTIMVVPGKELTLRALYERDRFDATRVAAILRHYSTLFKSLVTSPDCPVPKLPVLSGDEQQEQISRRNNTARNFSSKESVAHLFELQAQKTPQRVAIASENRSLSYDELNKRSTQFAEYLRDLGVGSGSLVAISLDRSVEMVVALLGILKAGAAYVPVDPAYPQERIAFLLEDACVCALVTQQALLESIPQASVQVICIDREWPQIAKSRSATPLPDVGPEGLAYVMYTSGSTGKPKGVIVQHRSVVNFLESMRNEPGLTSEDVLLAVTTLSFDIAGLELYLPLIVGARVEIATREVAVDPALLAAKLRDARATVMQATPSTWRMLIESGWKGDQHLKILCGGEALPVELANELLSCGKSVWNLYGPTETTIWSTVQQVQHTESALVPIGHPIANTQIYILDKELNLVPEGVAGELFIGGAGVALGYLNRLGLTAERFLPDSFAGKAEARMYRTGDLARYGDDGALEYLGRLDYQVKIRGHRIELGEIESVLEEHDTIAQAIVVASEVAHGDHRLTAYVIAAPGKTLSRSELTALLRAKLSSHMVPSALVQLDRFPLTSNGKIDRKALPWPQPKIEVQPETPTAISGLEAQLRNIWERVLDARPIGVRDNFFELGGHSLLAIRLFAEMEKVFGRNMPLATLFQAPTIEGFAGILHREDWSSAWSSLVALQPSGSAMPFFCVHSLGANLVSYGQLARYVGPEQPFYGLQPIGLDGRQTPHTRVEEMAAHYLRELRAIQPEGPYYLGGVCLGGVVAFEMSQQLHALGQEVGLLLLIDAGFPGKPKHMVDRVQQNGVSALADYYLGEVLLRSPKDRLSYLWTRFKNLGARLVLALPPSHSHPNGTAETNFERILQNVKKANLTAADSYLPQNYPGKITLLWCSETPLRSYRDRRMAWSQVAGGGLEVHTISGNHMTMVDYPHVIVLAEELRNCLRAAQGQATALSTRA